MSIEHLGPNTKKDGNRLDDIEELFIQADEDRDEQVNLTEFRSLMLTLNRQMRDEAVTNAFLKIDANHDGRIGFGEFRAWWMAG